MDATQSRQSPKDRHQESAGPPPRKELTQPALQGFEYLGVVPYVLNQSPRPAKARRQRRSRQVRQERVTPYPDQLSLPLRAV